MHGHFKLFRELVTASKSPVDWDSAGVSEDECLHVGLVDESSFEFNLLLVDSDYWLSSQALNREDGGVRVILDEYDDLVVVWDSLLRECKDI